MAETPRASRWLLALQPSHQISASCTTQITTLEPDKSRAGLHRCPKSAVLQVRRLARAG